MATANDNEASTTAIAGRLGLRAVPEGGTTRRFDLGSADERTLTIGEIISLLEALSDEGTRVANGFLIQSIHPVQDGIAGPARPITFCAATGATVSAMLDSLRRVRRDGWSATAPVYIDASTDSKRIVHSIRGIAAAR